jgi:chromosome segregation ATPase
LFASLQSSDYSLTSCEATEVLEKLTDDETVSFTRRDIKKAQIEREIQALKATEEQFTQKLDAYTELDREWNSWLIKQEDAVKVLDDCKQKEKEARQALTTAEELVQEASTDVRQVSNKLRGFEEEVRKSAHEMDRVSSTLTRKQERVRNALKRKTELMKGGIQVHYVTAEEVKQLRKKESELQGESKQVATMVARLQSRADKLKERADALERLKNN